MRRVFVIEPVQQGLSCASLKLLSGLMTVQNLFFPSLGNPRFYLFVEFYYSDVYHQNLIDLVTLLFSHFVNFGYIQFQSILRSTHYLKKLRTKCTKMSWNCRTGSQGLGTLTLTTTLCGVTLSESCLSSTPTLAWFPALSQESYIGSEQEIIFKSLHHFSPAGGCL